MYDAGGNENRWQRGLPGLTRVPRASATRMSVGGLDEAADSGGRVLPGRPHGGLKALAGVGEAALDRTGGDLVEGGELSRGHGVEVAQLEQGLSVEREALQGQHRANR